MDLEVIKNCINYGKICVETGLIYGNFGNLSIRYNDKIFITKSGAMLNNLEYDDIVVFSIHDQVPKEASSDTPIHLEIYKKTDNKAILHMHGDFSIILSLFNNEILPLDFAGKRFVEKIPIADGIFGSAHLTNEIIKKFENNVVLVKGHGSFSAGKSIKEAYALSCALETSCKINFFNELYSKINNI